MSRSSPTVVGVGNALLDHTYQLTNLPEPDGGAFVREYEERPGGVAANVVSYLHGFNYDAGIVARLGDDADGDTVREYLRGAGIDIRRVRLRDEDVTSYCVVLTGPSGERMIVGGGNSTLRLHLTDGDHAYVNNADVAFTSAYAPARVLADLINLARCGGPAVVFDLAGRFGDIEHRGFSREDLTAALPHLSLFVANVSAVRSYLQTEIGDAETLATGLRERGLARGALTNGADGALLFDGGNLVRVPSVDVDVVDTTGAGDAFTAGLIHSWLLDETDAKEAGRFAAATAALACTNEGARLDLPTVDSVESVQANQEF